MRPGSWPLGRGERLGPSLWEEASEGLCFSGRGAAVAAGPGEKRVAHSPHPGRRLSWSCAELVLCGRGGRPAAPCPAHLPSAHPALCPGQLLSPSLALIGAAGTLAALCAVQQVPPRPLVLLPCSRVPLPRMRQAWSLTSRWKGLPRPQRGPELASVRAPLPPAGMALPSSRSGMNAFFPGQSRGPWESRSL